MAATSLPSLPLGNDEVGEGFGCQRMGSVAGQQRPAGTHGSDWASRGHDCRQFPSRTKVPVDGLNENLILLFHLFIIGLALMFVSLQDSRRLRFS